MVKQEPFAVEQFMDKYETNITYNMGETCVDSLSIAEIALGETHSRLVESLLAKKLTYGHIKGSPELRSGIAALYDSPDITAENIVVTNGAIGANFLLFYTMVNPDDHVVVVGPTYQQLSSVPRMFGAKVDIFDIELENGYLPDLGRLRQLFQEKHLKLLVINNPNNPTGYVWETDTLGKIVELCKEFDVAIMSDEVYRPLFHFQATEPVKSLVNFAYDKVIATGSMSKAFSLAGLRLGWIVTRNTDYIAGFFEKRDYNIISVLMLDDYIASVALANKEKILERNHSICQKNLEHLDAFIDACKGRAEWKRPRGGSTCFIKVHIDKSTLSLAEDLAENHGVLVVPGEVFDMPGWLRIGFGNSTKDLVGGLEALKAAILK